MFKPLGHRLLVLLEEEKKKESTVVVVSLKEEDTQYAKVLAVGNGSFNNKGKHLPVDAQEGDRIILRKKSGLQIDPENQKLRLINEGDIIAIV
jgi:chaperonin GroES